MPSKFKTSTSKNTKPIHLRRATLKDYDVVADIERRSDSPVYSAYLQPAEIQSYIKHQVAFLIKLGAKTIGSIAYAPKRGGYARIKNLALYRQHQGKGLGHAAVALLLKKIKRFPRVDLTVHPRNSRAIALYLSFGFEIESWKDNFFGDGQPRLVMVWKNRTPQHVHKRPLTRRKK